jgi:predicted phage terminase large subunit-like protein
MTVLAPQVPIDIPAKLLPIFEPCRFKVMRGGRGGAKSHTVAQVLLAMGLRQSLRVLCVREVQKSLKESSMQVLRDYITRLGLEPYYEVLKTEIRSRINGTTFSFSGLKDHTADSIKSWEGCDIVWVEEAHSVTAHSWNILIPTIRKLGSEIWATYNPDQEDDYVHDRFVKHADPDAWCCEINWRDNPWFPKILDDERLKLKAINDDLYQHVWEGKCRSLAGLLFKRAWFRRYKPGEHPERLNLYIASDYAGGPDPNNPDSEPDHTEHGCAGLADDGDLWFVDWWSGQENPDVWIQAWLGMIRRNKPRPLIAFEEKGVLLRALDASINKAMREAQTYIRRESLASAGNKASRALGFAARAAAGTVWIPECEWGDRLINQLCAFNGQDGREDDMVDVCSLLARGLDLMADARPAPQPKQAEPEPFTDAWFAARDRRDAMTDAERQRYYR